MGRTRSALADWRWSVQSLITGRHYYADGTSEHVGRRFVLTIHWRLWKVRWKYRIIAKTTRWYKQAECGCSTWLGRRQATCMGHLKEHLMQHARDEPS